MDINSNDRCMRSISLLGTVASIGAKEVEVGYVPLPPTGEELPLKEFGKGRGCVRTWLRELGVFVRQGRALDRARPDRRR